MKKTLVIMGTHPKGLKLFDWSRTDCDIWQFNEAPNTKDEKGKLKFPNVDAFFQMHDEAIWKSPKNRVDTGHYDWLKSGKTPTAYMQKKYSEIPKSVEYPLKNILALLKNVRMIIDGKEKNFKYFTSTPDYAFGLVAEMWKRGQRYERVEVWAIELEMESEYRYQRTGFGFWIGYLAALGIELVIHNSIFAAPMYGYEGDIAIPSKVIEARIADLSKEMGNDKSIYTQKADTFLKSLSGLLDKNISVEVEKQLNELMQEVNQAGIISGKIKESTRYLEKARGMEEKAGASVFAPGEFDGSRIAHNKQYLEVKAEAENLNIHIGTLTKRLVNLRKGSRKRQRVVEEVGVQIAALMNKNILLLHIVGGIQENQFYLDSAKLSISLGVIK